MGNCGTKNEVREPKKIKTINLLQDVRVSPDIFVSLKEGTLS